MEWVFTWTCGLIRIISDYIYYTCVMHVNHSISVSTHLVSRIEPLWTTWRKIRSRMKWLRVYNVSRASYSRMKWLRAYNVSSGLLTENLEKNSEQNEVTSCIQCKCFIAGFLQKIWRKFWSRMKWLRAYNVSSRASYRKSEENFGAEWSDFVRTMFLHGFLTENLKKNSEQNEVTSCVQCFMGFLQKIWRKNWSRMKCLSCVWCFPCFLWSLGQVEP